MSVTEHITLLQLQTLIREQVEAGFGAPVWVVAEIAEAKTNRVSGHCYMELVERGGANGVPSAQARAVIWRQYNTLISSHFRTSTGRDLEAGMRVLLCVRVTYNELYGLTLQVVDIDPLYTLGDEAARRQAIIDQLKNEGVWDMNRETELPLVAQNIAVVSSPQAAGYQDFVNELNAYDYAFRVELFEATMQGAGAESSIIGALEQIAERGDFDVVVLIRGGGSQSDLNFLNSYPLAANVAQFPLPVLTGLGHDKDQSITDLVAHRALKTPTAVAQFLVQMAAEIDGALDDFETAICNRAEQLTATAEQRLTHFATLLAAQMRQLMLRSENGLSNLQTLLNERLARLFTAARHRLELAETSARAADPALILARGFAVVHRNGAILRSADDVKPDDELTITLATGEISATVK